MSIHQDLTLSGATTQEQPDTAWAVSFWHIPGGYQYNRAEIHEMFFSEQNKEQVETALARWNYPPEMPIVTDIKTHREIMEAAAQGGERRTAFENEMANWESLNYDFL